MMKSSHNIRAAAIASLLVCSIYYSILSNFHFFPITEGWFSVYAHLVLEEKIPYRDFFLYLTPLYVWLVSLISAVLGESIFALRVFGLVISCLIILLLYKILRSKFSPASSFAGATLGILYYQTGNAYISYDFTQILTLFSLLSISCLIEGANRLFISGDTPRNQAIDINLKSYAYFFFSGLFSSCAFLTKQSNGSFIALFSFVAFIYAVFIKNKGCKIKLKLIMLYGTGAIAPLFIVLAYLFLNQALSPFVQQIFFNAIAAKGSLSMILSNWITGVFTKTLGIQLFEVIRLLGPLYVVSHLVFWVALKFKPAKFNVNKADSIREIAMIVVFVVLFTTIITLAWNDNSTLRQFALLPGRHLQNYLIPIVIAWVIIGLILMALEKILPSWLRVTTSSSILILCTVGLLFGNGTSAGLSEISGFIAVGWFISWLCDKKCFPIFGVWAALLICALLATSFTYTKFDRPYAWWGVSEPNSRLAIEATDNPILGRLLISKETKAHLSEISKLINLHKGESIFAFPNIPIIYLLSDRWPDTKAIITWFDFLNDSDAISESLRLEATPPQTIVYLQLPEDAWNAHERLFRGGKAMGQRHILQYINHYCINQNGYKIVYKNEISEKSHLYICEKSN